jgi:hypothetical protein
MPRDITHPPTGEAAGSINELMATFDPTLIIAQGLVPGTESFRKFGGNEVVDTTEFVLSHSGIQVAPWMPLIAEEVEVASNDATDDAGNVGAQTLTIQGLDENFDFQEFEVTLDGVTPVVTTGTLWRRIYRAFVSTVGTYRGTNVGTITVRVADSPNEEIVTIGPGHGQTQTTHYTVPRGKTFYIKDYVIQLQAGKEMTIWFNYVPGADDIVTPFTGAKRRLLEFTGVQGVISTSFGVPLPLLEYTDVWASAVITAQTGSAYMEYSGTLIDNT